MMSRKHVRRVGHDVRNICDRRMDDVGLNVECRWLMKTKSRRQNGLDALLPSWHKEGSKKKKSEKHLKHWSREHHSFAFGNSESESHRNGVPVRYLFGIWPEQNCLTERGILPAQVSLSLPASVPRVRQK